MNIPQFNQRLMLILMEMLIFNTIFIAPGTYDEQLDIQGVNTSQSSTLRDTNNNLLLTQWAGLQIIGDNRPWGPGKSYVNGFENVGDSVNANNRNTDQLPPDYPYFYYPP